MALLLISVPQFPNVPALPGVPALARAPGSLAQYVPTSPMTADDATLPSSSGASSWGIFDQNGNALISPDCTFRFAEAQEYRVSDYPVEQGGFASYNKVTVPNSLQVSVSKGGTVSDRQSFRGDIVAAAAMTDPITVVTPEATYSNMTIDRYAFERSNERGANMLSVDLWIREIRTTKPVAFSNTQSPNGQAQTKGGTVGAQTPTQAQTAAAAGGAS